MADITMCTQTLCPDWGICYRAQATPSPMQSMAAFEYSVVDGVAHCESYIPIYQEANMATRKEITGVIAQIKCAMSELEDAALLIDDVREVMRDAAALIGAMADEIEDLRADA